MESEAAKRTLAFFLNDRARRVEGVYYLNTPNIVDMLAALAELNIDVVLCVPTAESETPGPRAVPEGIRVFEVPFYSSASDLLRHFPRILARLISSMWKAADGWDYVGGVAPSALGTVGALCRHCSPKDPLHVHPGQRHGVATGPVSWELEIERCNSSFLAAGDLRPASVEAWSHHLPDGPRAASAVFRSSNLSSQRLSPTRHRRNRCATAA